MFKVERGFDELRCSQATTANPPAEVLAVYGDLLAGLRQLAADLSQLSDQAAAMELCAAPSVKSGIEYTRQSVGLRPRIGGNARTMVIPARSFPR